MLFAAFMKVRAGTEKERLARRVQWQLPKRICVKVEYWLHTPDPESVFVFEADSLTAMMQITGEWNDLYEVNIFPAIAADEGLELARQMMG